VWQDKTLSVGLVVDDKKTRVAQFHKYTVENFVELMGAGGLGSKEELTRSHIYRRISLNSMLTYEEIFPNYAVGEFLNPENIPDRYKMDFAFANMDKWGISNVGSWSKELAN